MRSRTLREGSVGLLILLGLGLFGSLVSWLQGNPFVKNSYIVNVKFANAAGMQMGAPVRFRGVYVGRIINIKPDANQVKVIIEISPPDLIIPANSIAEANQAGLISETAIDIIPPLNKLLETKNLKNPLDPQCDRSLIICDRGEIPGQIGVSFNDFLRVTVRLIDNFTNPKFMANLNNLVQNSANATADVAKLTKELSDLTKTTKTEIVAISNSTIASSNSINRAVNQVSGNVDRLSNQLGDTMSQLNTQIDRTTNQINTTTKQIGTAAIQANQQFSVTASQTSQEVSVAASKLNRLADNLNNIVENNKNNLTKTLADISEISTQLRTTVTTLSPFINRIQQGELLQNLEKLSANAAQTSANLRDVSNTINNPNNIVLLQQTLDSARTTFQNVQKITSDLDDLTGDPTFRNNIRKLVNGLSGLVSSTQQLQQQTQVAEVLVPLRAAVNISVTNGGKIVEHSMPIAVPISPEKTLSNSQPIPINQPLVNHTAENKKQVSNGAK